MKMQKGFTLIELMIVVAIIAILAAIAISQYQDYVIRSQVSEGSSLADGVKTAVGEFYNNTGRFPNATDPNISFGLSLPASIAGSYVGSLGVTQEGVIMAHFADSTIANPTGGNFKANAKILGAVLSFSPITHAGSIEWNCYGDTTLLNKWLPTTCRR
jgi:type IV pilus assembly protein PilA